MQRIRKRPEPSSLTRLRRENPQADWDDDYKDKQAARELLCTEQGALCCFCLGRIIPSAAGMKVAHFVPQKPRSSRELPNLGLTWTNLFGACKGNERTRDEKQPERSAQRRPLTQKAAPQDELTRKAANPHHCDTRQRNQILDQRLHPCTYEPGLLHFDRRGRAIAEDKDKTLQKEIDDKLGLNLPKLCEARLVAFQTVVQRFPAQGTWTAARLEQAIRHVASRTGDGRLTPYYVCVQDMLKIKLDRAKAPARPAKAAKARARQPSP